MHASHTMQPLRIIESSKTATNSYALFFCSSLSPLSSLAFRTHAIRFLRVLIIFLILLLFLFSSLFSSPTLPPLWLVLIGHDKLCHPFSFCQSIRKSDWCILPLSSLLVFLSLSLVLRPPTFLLFLHTSFSVRPLSMTLTANKSCYQFSSKVIGSEKSHCFIRHHALPL